MSSSSLYRIGFAGVLALVLLRVGTGWHFYKEGVAKWQGKGVSSAALFQASKGPLAATFRTFVWDVDGSARLDLAQSRKIWNDYRSKMATAHSFDNAQQQRAERAFATRDRQLGSFFADYQAEIDEYFRQLERWHAYRRDGGRRDVPSLAYQNDSLGKELAQQRGQWLPTIDAIWTGYENDLLAIAGASGPRLVKPGRRLLDSETIDSVIPYFLITVGVCLVFGLLTRLAALAGAVFLTMVVASQWPGWAGATPTYYQSVELLGLLVLAGTGAGRFAGLDFLVRSLRMRCCPPKRRNSHASDS